jgi:hypothetical protein
VVDQRVVHNSNPQIGADVERLLAGNYLVPRISAGAKIPVGGSCFDRSSNILCVIADTERPLQAIAKTIDRIEKLELGKIAEWLGKLKASIDTRIFAACYSFLEFTADLKDNSDAHFSFYTRPLSPNLSEILDAKAAKCAELAILGQLTLQKMGFTSYYFGGGWLESRTHGFAEAHSFVVITDRNDTYVWEVANPLETTGGLMPRILKMPPDFLQEMRSARTNKFCVGTNILDPTEKGIYGVIDGTSVQEAQILAEKH